LILKEITRIPARDFENILDPSGKYTPGNTMLEWLETEARETKKGLWADPQPVPPWEWRKRQDIGERGIVPEGKVRSATG